MFEFDRVQPRRYEGLVRTPAGNDEGSLGEAVARVECVPWEARTRKVLGKSRQGSVLDGLRATEEDIQRRQVELVALFRAHLSNAEIEAEVGRPGDRSTMPRDRFEP